MEKKKIQTFEDLRVWQKGIELVKQIYLLTSQGHLNRDFGLKDQLRRASISIPTNIAEPQYRIIHFLRIAKGDHEIPLGASPYQVHARCDNLLV